METYLKELRAWLDSQKDVPLEEMTDFFTQRVDGYDEHMLAHGRDHYRTLAQHVPEDVQTLLDLGCGTGLELEPLWQRLPDVHVTGVDLTRSMLDALERRYAGRPLRTVCGDYFALELGDAAYDGVLTFESLHHFPAERKLPLYRKIRRALKPGGRFVYGDYFARSPEEQELLASECARRRAEENIPEDVFVHFDTPLTAEVEKKLLEQAGFALMDDIRLDDSTHILLLEAR